MDKITERQIIGNFYKRLSIDTGAAWIDKISNMFQSNQASEEYAWLGMVPAMREWIGGRNAKGFRENSITIKNKHYESTLDFLVRDLRRDKTGQINARIADEALRANSHWATLLSTLIAAGTTQECYDGQYFFDTDHEEGDSGAQSNKINCDISDFAVATAGTTTVPSVAEMQLAIAYGIQAMLGFVDDQGEPMNENALSFLVMVPPSLYNVARTAVLPGQQVAETQTVLTGMKSDGMATEVAMNTRVSAWTASFAIFRTDSNVKALIRQEETRVQMKAKGEGSEYEFDNDAHQYGIDAWRNVGYGMWQDAILVTMT